LSFPQIRNDIGKYSSSAEEVVVAFPAFHEQFTYLGACWYNQLRALAVGMLHLDWWFFPVFDLLDSASDADLAAAQGGPRELVGVEYA
jgi:hypothetical protein